MLTLQALRDKIQAMHDLHGNTEVRIWLANDDDVSEAWELPKTAIDSVVERTDLIVDPITKQPITCLEITFDPNPTGQGGRSANVLNKLDNAIAQYGAGTFPVWFDDENPTQLMCPVYVYHWVNGHTSNQAAFEVSCGSVPPQYFS